MIYLNLEERWQMTEKEEEGKKKLDEQTHKSIKHNLTQHLSREK